MDFCYFLTVQYKQYKLFSRQFVVFSSLWALPFMQFFWGVAKCKRAMSLALGYLRKNMHASIKSPIFFFYFKFS